MKVLVFHLLEHSPGKIADMRHQSRASEPVEFDELSWKTGARILDTRPPQQFSKGFIDGSLNIGINGNFALWINTIIGDVSQRLILVADTNREKEVVTRLSILGYHLVAAYLKGGIEAWEDSGLPTETIDRISAASLAALIKGPDKPGILDVRTKEEFDSAHLFSALNIPLNNYDLLNLPDKDKTYHVHCSDIYRSMIFISMMKSEGYHNMVFIPGGFTALSESGKFQIVRSEKE